ncbi:phosphoribosyltransferase [Candidatus Giovannonibacteria bacterium]|nr:phosphoribosyltransferase [Candidatus Giovannonibacteria bacterium]
MSQALKILERVGAILRNDHFVYTNWLHGSEYVLKDALLPHVEDTSKICSYIASHFTRNYRFLGDEQKIQVVAAPAVGAVALGSWVAYWLSMYSGKKTLFVYADKTPDGSFIFKRGYGKYLYGKNVLVVEDVLTTGGSAKKVVEAVKLASGTVLGVGALCNRGDITAKDVGDVPELHSLTEIRMQAWLGTDCPLCKKGVPVNEEIGHGSEFVKRRAAA